MTQSEVCFLPACDLVRHIKAREISAAEVMRAHLQDIVKAELSANLDALTGGAFSASLVR